MTVAELITVLGTLDATHSVVFATGQEVYPVDLAEPVVSETTLVGIRQGDPMVMLCSYSHDEGGV